MVMFDPDLQFFKWVKAQLPRPWAKTNNFHGNQPFLCLCFRLHFGMWQVVQLLVGLVNNEGQIFFRLADT